MRPKLTIGMATFDDYDGCWFTLQSLRLYHDLSQVELLVVDNKPDSPASAILKQNIEGWMQAGTAGARYIPMPSPVGTTAPRERIFAEAQGEAVLCIDSHVLLAPGAIAQLIVWYDANPDCSDLIQGPLLLDNLHTVSPAFLDAWRGEMWGIWGTAWQVCPGGEPVTVVENQGHAQFQSLEMDPVPLTSSLSCGRPLPDIPWPGHESVLAEQGLRQLGLDPADEFEIPGQGLGLFSCRKDAWPGFNPNFRGFGGEEMYIHEKIRQRGDRCLCLGFLKWVHRFARPTGVKYPLTRWNKVRNYVLGHQELGLPLDRVHEHFVGGNLMSQSQWDYLLKDPLAHTGESTGQQLPETLEAIFDAVRPPLGPTRDLDRHMPYLAKLASECQRITEFSHRRESLIAWAAGGSGYGFEGAQPREDQPTIESHNSELNHPFMTKLLVLCPSVTTDDTADPSFIEPTDLLFLDQLHTRARVLWQLENYAASVRRWIVLHDTHVHALKGEDGGPGLHAAMREFLESEAGSEWFVYSHTNDQYGLTVFGRLEEDRPAQPVHVWAPANGPGVELKKMLATLGVEPSPTCDCNGKAAQMDVWGVAGCRENREQIIGWMREGQTRWGWKDKFAAAGKAVLSGLAFKLNPLDPYPDLIDEAIRREEQRLLQTRKEAA